MNKKFEIVEWNLHGMTGTGVGGNKYLFPVKLIKHSIVKIGCPSIIVFTEFISAYFYNDDGKTKECANNLKYEIEQMGYTLYMTSSQQRRNGICIAVNQTKVGPLHKKCESDNISDSPDYLAVGNDEFVIFGVRLPSSFTNIQMKRLLSEMSKYENVIAIGDFNMSHCSLINNREIVKYNRDNSKNAQLFYVHECYDESENENNGLIDESCCSIIDHVITSFDAKIEWEYNWDYMIDLFESVKNKATYINMRSIPDHAMLKVNISVI